MFYLRQFFLFILFIVSYFSPAGEELGTPEYQVEPNFSRVLEDSPCEVRGDNKERDLKVSDLYPGVVKFILENGEEIGTGFFIKPDMLSTAGHVAEVGSLYFRDSITGACVLTEVLAIDGTHDLALLQAVNYKSKNFYLIGPLDKEKSDFFMEREVERLEGNAVTIPGFPHGSFNIVVGNIDKQDTWMWKRKESTVFMDVVFKTHKRISTFGGMSGAPVFYVDFEDEELIGVAITTNVYPIREFIGFMPVRKLRDLVRKWESGEILSPKKEAENKIIKMLSHIIEYKKKITLH